MVIDFHMHAFPDALAERALGNLSESAGIPYYSNGTIEDLKAKMKNWGVDVGVILNIATNPKQQKNVNSFAQASQGEGIIPFGSIHPFADDALEELDRIHAMGLKGIKLHPEYQEFDVDDTRVYPVYEKCRQLGLLIIFHAGVDKAFPNSLRAAPKPLRTVVDAFPGLTVIAAHLGGYLCWEDVYRHLCGSSAYLDTSFIADDLDPILAKKIIRKHGAEKVLFGSDCPWMDSRKSLEYLKKLKLTQEEMDKIVYRNAKKLLDL